MDYTVSTFADLLSNLQDYQINIVVFGVLYLKEVRQSLVNGNRYSLFKIKDLKSNITISFTTFDSEIIVNLGVIVKGAVVGI